jgi:hypothetical protein
MEECQKMFSATAPNYSTIHDTISVNYSLRENQQGNLISRLPGEFVRSGLSADNYSYSESQYQGRRQKGISYSGNTFSTYPWDTILCWKGYTNYESSAGFTDGLGKTRTYWYQADPPMVSQMIEDLVYYKKGSVSWGTPVASNCFVLVDVESTLADLYPRVDVVPNPAETSVQITLHGFLPDDHPGYSLYNYSGIRVLAGKAITNPFVISRGGLPSGLYILTINDENGMIRGKTKIFFQ